MASTVSGDSKKEKESREFASAVLTGTIIGRTLQDALRSLEEEDTQTFEIDKANAEGEEEKPPIREVATTATIQMNGKCVQGILESFQQGVAKKKHSYLQSSPGIAQGKVDSYNRYSQNWMVSMDSVKLKERPTKFRKRRRDDRPSLWDRDDDNNNNNTEKEVEGKVQLLAYGDIA
eukprot:CAMPEP_0116089420 /NCGR_PEP_ID=MMETSP0327-20121206/6414_1 /TAXON_ID=44447 /ORGANISM="Pseudo-nitzschia delicatissima, Strain B596" /LENGTH=175 /DNA_ID=CAMNT_0003580607 /DNA_START=106 /DNA_END=634 /DNA_ORIENTATION=+